ncbi:MAG: hypothetical protein FJ104_05025 [Deltaproteobacteria bacterium]|nr:hypothetical protein [Deltaproteobacteria bacterium]
MCKTDADCVAHVDAPICVDDRCVASDSGSQAGSGGSGGGGATSSGGSDAGTVAALDGGGTGGGSAGGTGSASRTLSVDFVAPLGLPMSKCQTFSNPFGRAVGIGEMRAHSTQWLARLWVYRVPGAVDGAVGNCATTPGTELTNLIYFGQALDDDVALPSGVAMALAAGYGLQIAIDYGNQGAVDDEPAHVDFTVTPVDGGFEPAALGLLTDVSLLTPQTLGPTGVDVTCVLDTSVQVAAATGHVLSHGQAFVAAAGATTLFASEPWDRKTAVAKGHSPALSLASGSSVALHCEYFVNGNLLHFGGDYWGVKDEQCSLFLYHYPPVSAPLLGSCN